jgi:hypothetical protein
MPQQITYLKCPSCPDVTWTSVDGRDPDCLCGEPGIIRKVPPPGTGAAMGMAHARAMEAAAAARSAAELTDRSNPDQPELPFGEDAA